MAYDIFIKQSAQKELDKIPKQFREPIEQAIEDFREEPRPYGAIPLKGKHFKGLHRYRVGNYRIIYQIDDGKLTVLVVKIGDRKDVYR